MKTAAHIFLAHAHEDKDSVRRLHARLKGRGYNPWLDEINLIPGHNWQIEIPKVIKQCNAFLACLSKRSVEKSGYIQKEFRLALDTYAEKPPNSIYLIPVKLDDCSIPDLQIPQLGVRLRDIHWVDLWKRDGFDKLIVAIESALSKNISHEEARTSQSAIRSGLSLFAPSGVTVLYDINWRNSFNTVTLHLANKHSDNTFDDVIVELRLPSGIAFVRAGAARGEKSAFGHVMIPLSHPANPGASVDIGYVRKELDSWTFGAMQNGNVLEWTITARDITATSGSIDISWLHEDQTRT